MRLGTLKDLYIEQLRDLYNAEEQVLNALPGYADGASSEELVRALRDHVNTTRKHKERLEEMFGRLGEDPTGEKCRGMEGLLRECDDMLQAEGDPNVRDAGLIATWQRVEHYEVAGYGCSRAYADRLEETEAGRKLQQILDENAAFDEELTRLAEEAINPVAAATA